MKKYWISFLSVIIVSFTVLSIIGIKIYQQKPPIPERIVTKNGEIVFTKSDIQEGQNVWQAMGGMESGSVWGHGSYVAPDWTADWLHRELVTVLNIWSAQNYGTEFSKLTAEQQSSLKAKLIEMYRTNTYNDQTGEIQKTYFVSPVPDSDFKIWRGKYEMPKDNFIAKLFILNLQ